MTESNGKRQPGSQFHRLTLRDVKKDRGAGLLTAKGAIFYTVIASHKPGTPIKIDPQHLVKELSISKTAFYRAVAELKIEGRIDFEVRGHLIIHVPTNEKTGEPEYLALEDLSQKRDSDSQKRDSDSQKRDSDSQKRDSDSQKRDGKALKSSPSNSFSTPSDIQISQISSDIERENAREEEEEGDRGFRDWLFNRANSLPQKPALMEQWIDKEMLKAANRREFAQYQATRVTAPIPAILPQENLSPQDYWAAVEARRNGNGQPS